MTSLNTVNSNHDDSRSAPTRDQRTRNAAIALRQLWMTQMGLDEAEIQNALADDDIDLNEEWEQLVALRAIQQRNAAKDASGT